MLKRYVILFLIILSFFQTTSMVHAREADPGEGAHIPSDTPFIPPVSRTLTCEKDGLINDDIKEWMEDSKEKATLTDKFLIGQTQNLTNMGAVNSISNLVYGNPYCVWANGEKMSADGVFTVTEREKIIDPVFKMLGVIYATLVTLAIMASALRLGFKAYSPQSRADFWQDVTYWVLSALFLASFTLITDILFGLNTAIVNSFYSMTAGRADNISIIAGFKEDWVIGFLFTLLAEWILSLILNIIYIARKITILLLMIMGVVAAVSLLFAKSRYFFGVWLKELIGNIFIQSVHALILFSFAMMAESGAGVIMKLGMMIMFIPLSGMISKWLNLGDSSTKLGQTLTMTGLAGIGGAMMLAKQSGSVMRGGGQGGDAGLSPSLSTVQTSSGGGADTGPTSISADGAGIHSSGYQKTKDTVGKIGGFVGAVGGAVAGPAGVAVGMKVGSMAARGAVQAGRNVVGTFKGARETVKDVRQYASQDGKSLKSNWTDLEQRRKMMGNIGETLGTTLSTGGTGAGTVGKNLGQMLSMTSQKRIQETPEIDGGFGGPKNAEELQQMYGGQDGVWVQNKDHSYIAVKNSDGELKRITPYGAGDSTLAATGETRMMDIQIGQPAFSSDTGYQEATNPTTPTILDQYGNPMGAKPKPQPILDSSGQPISTPGTPNQEGIKPGKAGSSFQFQARSDVYTEKDGQKLKDTRINPSKINLDTYIGHSALKGGERSKTDRVGDLLYNTSEKTKETATTAGIGIRRTGEEIAIGAHKATTTVGTGIKVFGNDVKESVSNMKEKWNESDAWVKNAEEHREQYERRRDFL